MSGAKAAKWPSMMLANIALNAYCTRQHTPAVVSTRQHTSRMLAKASQCNQTQPSSTFNAAREGAGMPSMCKCLKNRGVTAFLLPPGGAHAATTSAFSILVQLKSLRS